MFHIRTYFSCDVILLRPQVQEQSGFELFIYFASCLVLRLSHVCLTFQEVVEGVQGVLPAGGVRQTRVTIYSRRTLDGPKVPSGRGS